MKFRIASEQRPDFKDLDIYVEVVEDDADICSATGWDLYDVTVKVGAPAGTAEKVKQMIKDQSNCIETCNLKSWLPQVEEDPRPHHSTLPIPPRIHLERSWLS